MRNSCLLFAHLGTQSNNVSHVAWEKFDFDITPHVFTSTKVNYGHIT